MFLLRRPEMSPEQGNCALPWPGDKTFNKKSSKHLNNYKHVWEKKEEEKEEEEEEMDEEEKKNLWI